jgi:hypothetical protein
VRAPHPVPVALVEGLLLAALEVAVLGLLGLALGAAQDGWWSRWDGLFAALIGGVAAAVGCVEAVVCPRVAEEPVTPARTAVVTAAVALAAASGLFFAHAQTGYVFALSRGLPWSAALVEVGRWGLWSLDAWTDAAFSARPLLVAVVVPHAGVALARARRLPPVAEAALAALLTLTLAWASLAGFAGLPQPEWLLGTPWLSPLVGPFLYVQVLLLPAALPLTRRAAQRLLRRLSAATPEPLAS